MYNQSAAVVLSWQPLFRLAGAYYPPEANPRGGKFLASLVPRRPALRLPLSSIRISQRFSHQCQNTPLISLLFSHSSAFLQLSCGLSPIIATLHKKHRGGGGSMNLASKVLLEVSDRTLPSAPTVAPCSSSSFGLRLTAPSPAAVSLDSVPNDRFLLGTRLPRAGHGPEKGHFPQLPLLRYFVSAQNFHVLSPTHPHR